MNILVGCENRFSSEMAIAAVSAELRVGESIVR
jgi:hypothetical protein